ncbi:uncharacterized protein LOC141594966 [Silene latifolia]|uniref:uncharacterized protein LOC141594966 n=1 Tax=Silene latifolia TaxID=37657 RepID=UPI003D786538
MIPGNAPTSNFVKTNQTPGAGFPPGSRSADSGSLTNQQYLELREMLIRVLGMPPPLEKACPDSYADSPFVDAISVVAMPKGSISTFSDLVNEFTEQFASSRKPQKHAVDLYRIVQGVNKTIREFNTRFNNENVAVRECDVSTTVEEFRRGLHHDSNLYKLLTMQICHSFEAVQEKAATAIRLEEDMLARARIPSTPSVSSTSAVEKSGRKKPTGKEEERYKPYGIGVNRIDNREENQQLPTLAEYGFTTSIGGILKALREMEHGVIWPRPPIEQDKVGFSKQAKPSPPPTCTKIINVITGGSDLSGLTYSAAKRHATKTKGNRPETSWRVSHDDLPVVAFNEEDVHDSQEHHDALIITLSMAIAQLGRSW